MPDQSQPVEIVQVPTQELKPADYNPRKMSDKQRRALETSLSEFGFLQPIIVNRATGVIVGGHQRLQAALTLGVETVPVVYVDLTVEREKALNVALNKISGDWDYPQLIELLDELEDGREFELTGFQIDEFQSIQAEWLEEGKAGREGKTPPPPRVPNSRFGEVYALGDHLIVCGDSTDPESYAHAHPDDEGPQDWRMVFCDPPYNIAYEGGTDEKLTILNDSFETEDAFRDFLYAFLVPTLNKNKGATYLCYASNMSEPVFAAWRLAGMHSSSQIHLVHEKEAKKQTKRKKTKDTGAPADVILWDKDGFTLGRSHYQAGHEPILYGWHKGATNKFWCGDRNQSNVWTYPKPSRNKEHPTMKPVALCERAIRNSSQAGDWVGDPFGGSGSTLIAAENIGRRAYLIEMDPRFIDVQIERYRSLAGHGEIRRVVEVEDSVPFVNGAFVTEDSKVVVDDAALHAADEAAQALNEG